MPTNRNTKYKKISTNPQVDPDSELRLKKRKVRKDSNYNVPPTDPKQITTEHPNHTGGMIRGRVHPNAMLAALIQEIGMEPMEGSTKLWTRLEAMVRKLWLDGLSGDKEAVKILFERGWGKLPTPIEVDFTMQIQKVALEAKLTPDDLQSDPILRELLISTGLDELQITKLLNAPVGEVIENASAS